MGKIKNQKDLSFYKWTYQSYIKNALMPLLTLQFICICIYFGTNNWLKNIVIDILAEQKQHEITEIIRHKSSLIKLGFTAAFLGLIFFYFLFLWHIAKKAKKMSSTVSVSISKINSLMDQIGNGDYNPKLPDFNLAELQDLGDHLIEMGQHLGETNRSLLLTQTELKKREDDLKALVNSINDLIMEVNFNGNITSFWSRSNHDLYKLYEDGELTSIYAILDDENAMIVKEKISHVLHTTNTVTIDFTLKSDPDLKYFEASICPKLNDKNKVVILARDITKQKKLSESIILAKEEAEKASKAKSEFLSSMSHELRNPLNAILGFSQILELDPESPLTSSQSQSVHEITNSGNYLLELINEVLDLAKIESGKLNISIEPVQIKAILDETLAIIRPFADKNDIKIITPPLVESLDEFISADHTRLKQVLLNLLSNAVKYNRKNGEVTFYCDRVNNKCRFHVIDTGIGLSNSDLELIFKPFQRLGSLNNSIEGTGIGLTVAKQLVELMNGNIYVDSEPGVGSHFWVEFSSAEACISNSSEAIDSSKDQKLYFETVNCKVLYAEDNAANLRLVERILSKLGNLEMLSATCGELCLDLALNHKPDLILLDIGLPGIDGYQVLKNLKINETTKNIPVIAISAHAMPTDIELGLSIGFDDYITKPINIPSFIEKISNVLKNKGGYL